MTDPHEAIHQELGQRYELVDVLGEGGMGTVYLARDHGHDRLVAIKTVHPDLISGTASKRFEREIAITARLRHPHILPLLDSGVAGGFRYYVTPYIEGDSLSQHLLEHGQLPVETAVRIARQVAEALEYAHQGGILHRDIKPGNILLTGDQVMIADFGIARAIELTDATTLTIAGEAVGTVAYMSPEQVTGDRELDGRTDLYSLGCVLFEMLAGRPPFRGDSPGRIARQHVIDEPPILSDFREDVPPYVEAVVRRALAKQRDKRYPTAAELLAALQPFRTAEDHLAASSATYPRRLPLSTELVVGTLAAVILVALALWFSR